MISNAKNAEREDPVTGPGRKSASRKDVAASADRAEFLKIMLTKSCGSTPAAV